MNAVIADGTHGGSLILVNRDCPLAGSDWDDLMPVSEDFPRIQLRQEAALALRALLSEIRSGTEIVPVSGYRSRQEQVALYRESLVENGEEFTRKFVALPDCSEHQTGLAIDLGWNRPPIDFIRPDFPQDGICGKFRAQAGRFGFILRYPQGKERVTGIAWEPWHFRYVGRPHGEIIAEKGMVLEEYHQWLKGFTPASPLSWESGGEAYEIFCSPTLPVPLPETWAVSGNNIDGYIVTLRRNGYGNCHPPTP